jgi:hypothetical protein
MILIGLHLHDRLAWDPGIIHEETPSHIRNTRNLSGLIESCPWKVAVLITVAMRTSFAHKKEAMVVGFA